jgi:hypothetical protein
MSKLLSGLIDRIFVVLGVMTFSQAPHFFYAYTQRLGGHLAELRMQISTLRIAAEKSGKSFEQYIDKFVTHKDPDIALQGEFMQSLLARFSDISEAYYSMVQTSSLGRPFHFFQFIQWDVAKMTVEDYQFGLSFTTESAIYALLGMGLGYLLFSVVKFFLSLPFKAIRKVEIKV